MSYGPYWTELFRHAAEQVDKVLRGAKAADIPVEQPTKFYLVINAKAAKAIGVELSPSLLAGRRSDRVMSRMSAWALLGSDAPDVGRPFIGTDRK